LKRIRKKKSKSKNDVSDEEESFSKLAIKLSSDKDKKKNVKEDSDDEDEEVKESGSVDTSDKFLSGKVIAICGKLPKMTSAEAAKLIEKNGGKFAKSISKDVTHVICADPKNDKTKKFQQAKEAGKILVSESFLKKGS